MTDVETLTERVRAVERAVTDGDHGFPAVDELSELNERIDALEQRDESLDERTEELESATQALRGYVGNVRSVNERVEQRADAALAATDRLEQRLDASEARTERESRDKAVGYDREPAGSGVERANNGPAEAGGKPAPERRRPARERRQPTEGASRAVRTERAVSPDSRGHARSEDDTAEDGRDLGVLERIRSLL